MAFQIRSVATFRLVNLDTGLTPGRLFLDFQQSLVVGADQVGELYFARKDARASIAGRLAGSVDGDVVLCVNRKVFHFRVISWRGKDRSDHIHHSEVPERQEDYAINRRWRRAGDGRTPGSQIALGCVQ